MKRHLRSGALHARTRGPVSPLKKREVSGPSEIEIAISEKVDPNELRQHRNSLTEPGKYACEGQPGGSESKTYGINV